MKITGKTDLSAIKSSKVPNFTPDSDLLQKPISKKHSARKTRNSGGGLRLRSTGIPTAGKRGSRPETPLLRWKFVEVKEEEKEEKNDEIESEKQSDSGRKSRRREAVTTVSARKLAAGLWRLQVPEKGVSGGGELCNVAKNNGFGFQPAIDHSGIHSPARHNRKSFDSRMKEVPQSPNSVTGSRNKFLHKLEPTFHFSNSAMEGATKWDPCSWKASEDVKRIYGESKHLEEQVGVMSVVSGLESELEAAQARIHDLETERRASKKKLEQFLKKLNEERAAWRSREHEKIRAVIDDIKSELNRERKNRQRMEIVNSKLVNELADAKLSAKRYMQDYEKERKARELTEEVCDELAKEIGEDKAEVEALKRESMKMREEVDDERKMLQMAEVWREERVQMKLVDAKVTLEEKYSQMNKLVTELEAFLNSKRSDLDIEETNRAEALKQCAESVNIQEISNFKYEPANPDDIYAVFEEVNFAEMNAKDIQQFDKNGGNVDDEDDDDESGWETVSNLNNEGSNYSPNGSDPSITKSTRREWEENEGTPITEITEVCVVQNNKVPKKGSSISRLWRSSYSSNGDNCKIISMEGLNGRLSNESHLSNGAHLSPDRSSGVSASDWSCSPGSGSNPHITKGMKGCIEWPRGVMQKNSLKAKLLEARIESQKVQLRQVLKQKI
ncbi:hypothetical protein HanXRQr2_Chr08g0351431 [Helianthus annuus]|uniref:Uncharacterized protein n=1 Tax=Helianthus annuus TaxID=4232 RepID=A0A251U7V2_HELAN|nr:uncharacterized protein LOC110873622 [Helianthus annuus]KAF5796436.1 hypothetical protein HanXRQr2_Chr08g0351431 [Helianthus annuus]KAJ0720070.1 putative protein BRANCHLESS TRICHOME [Helianthus annuus]KAJ0723294.1 putative protein BRANCHLESS TRICHOME [Helianthus annuus]KAJ0902645.1 hypothetical protein HanPSC8_Chr08g0339451 [Helianthus annuus]